MKKRIFTGAGVALVTPMNADGSVNWQRLGELIDFQVENALLSSALEGNTTAQIFWLKNRRPDKWRDKQKEDTNAEALERLDNILLEIKKDALNSTKE